MVLLAILPSNTMLASVHRQPNSARERTCLAHKINDTWLHLVCK